LCEMNAVEKYDRLPYPWCEKCGRYVDRFTIDTPVERFAHLMRFIRLFFKVYADHRAVGFDVRTSIRCSWAFARFFRGKVPL
jgi:hypothetical protein